jgi:hypothetical protein
MDDRDAAQLERDLRGMADAGRPTAPKTIHDAIDAVAARPRTRRLSGSGPLRRRNAAAVAGLAAALVVALAASSFVLSVRQGQGQTPSASPTSTASAASPAGTGPLGYSMRWIAVGEPAPGGVTRVANGYVGECATGGLPAVCTSPDGIAWSLPPDPSIFALDRAGTFGGWSIAHASAGWVATGTVDPGTWFSSDGVRWAPIEVGRADLTRAHVQALRDGFAMLALTANAGPVTLLSSDGRTWRSAVLPADVSGVELAGDAGLTATRWMGSGDARTGTPVISSDGGTWTALALPASVDAVGSTVGLPGGGFLGLATGRASGLLSSRDGVTWASVEAIGSTVTSIARIGSLVAVVGTAPGSEATYLWLSPDGSSWHRADGLAGVAEAPTIAALDDRIALFDSSHLVRVGSVAISAAPSPTPVPSPTPAISSPTPNAPAIENGGWRWHPANVEPVGVVVRVANGYVANCGGRMCTSPNGWDWQSPPDPAIFRADGDAVFTPTVYYHVANGPYAISTESHVWYSSDGVGWHLSQTPPAPNLYAPFMGSGTGFSLLIPTSDAFGGDCPRYVSTDGATWTANGTAPCIWRESGDPAMSGGMLGQGAGIKTKGPVRYSADGATWVKATVPGVTTNPIEGLSPYRLPDGILVASTPSGPIRSANGTKWELMPGFDRSAAAYSTSLAVAGGAILLRDDTGTVRQSFDEGETFSPVLAGANSLEQWGDLVAVRAGATRYVGEPIGPYSAASPVALPHPELTPAPTPTLPPGGISGDEAIRIATQALQVNPAVAATARAYATDDPHFGRWVWQVSFSTGDQQGRFADIDYFTGEVVGQGDWVA